MKKVLLYAFALLLSSCTFSQQNTVTSGGNASGTGGTVSYSIGQIDYINMQGSNGSVNQGVQQPYEFFPLEIAEASLGQVILYPNPTNEFIVLQFESFTNDLSYALYDIAGRLLVKNPIEHIETQIDMRTFACGEYNLLISNTDQNIQSIKIIKN